MRKIKVAFGIAAIVGLVLAIFLVLRSEFSLVTNPKGPIAQSELHVIHRNILLMLIVVIPTFLFLFWTIWKYRVSAKGKYETEGRHKKKIEIALWTFPSAVIAVMAFFTWHDAHELDPYRSLESDTPQITIQVVALDWKWLFIYPEQGIATLNFVQFPTNTPIHFELAADGSPMNSFWIPSLSGQIYAMTGMTTHLHMMADAPGEYRGRAAEINGEGFADMTFVVKSTNSDEFQNWIALVKQSPEQLTEATYNKLAIPSQKDPITFYAVVEKDLFHKIVMKYMHP